MLDFMRCQPEHIRLLTPQTAQESEGSVMLGPEAYDVIAASLAFSGWDGSRCVGAAGLSLAWPGRAMAWALLSKDAGKHMLTITRKVRQVFESYPVRRIETHVVEGFPEGRRWAEAIGMRCETPEPMRGYSPDGQGAYLYARVKD